MCLYMRLFMFNLSGLIAFNLVYSLRFLAIEKLFLKPIETAINSWLSDLHSMIRRLINDITTPV